MILKPEFNCVRGTPYSFASVIIENESKKCVSVTAVFQRRSGYLDNLTLEEAPVKTHLSAAAVESFLTGTLGDDIPTHLVIGKKSTLLFPKHELLKAAEALSSLPRDVLIKDSQLKSRFKSPHKWPFKPWGYNGLSSV